MKVLYVLPLWIIVLVRYIALSTLGPTIKFNYTLYKTDKWQTSSCYKDLKYYTQYETDVMSEGNIYFRSFVFSATTMKP